MTSSCRQVPFVWPSTLALSGGAAGSRRHWIQVAKTGTFYSSRYGKFSITTADLDQMLLNFTSVTPVPPTQLPVDYDHLSMDPKSPGDGKAAGWFTGPMELRDNGQTLWAEVEFTPDAAEAIQKREYRFISPSFLRDYVWKNGKNIGTTLIAAAITNHPFLEGMAAITLSNHMGEMAVAMVGGTDMTPGQRVALKRGPHPSLNGIALDIIEVSGAGDEAFVKLRDSRGTVVGWFPVAELEPAPAEGIANAAATLLTLATARMRGQSHLSLRDALHQIATEHPTVADTYVRTGRAADDTQPVVATRQDSGDAKTLLMSLTNSRVAAKHIPYGDALREVMAERPDLAESYAAAFRR